MIEYPVAYPGEPSVKTSACHPALSGSTHEITFNAKATGTVGKLTPEGKVTTYALSTVGSAPIYVRAGDDGTMWVTELIGNATSSASTARS